jgi:hypothetical protein
MMELVAEYNPMGVCCADCGAPYGKDGWCDVVVPDAIWDKIAPEGGVLCFRCMTKRIETHGLEKVAVNITSGPYWSAAEEWRMIGLRKGREEMAAENLALLDRLADWRERAHMAAQRDKGEVWYWQGDEEDHLESLTCPVVIPAEKLRHLAAYIARFEAILGAELQNRCYEQDEQWGGHAHDDKHGRYNWVSFIRDFAGKASLEYKHPEIYEDKMLDVAALAIKAIQSSRRKRA